MFTGLIQEVGIVRSVSGAGDGVRMRIDCALASAGDPAGGGALELGESICTGGVCLTVETADARGFTCFASRETLLRSNLGELRAGDGVNLERSMRMGDRLGGHLVTGHVDATTVVRRVEKKDVSHVITFDVPAGYEPLFVEKGSVAVDGISLTIASLPADGTFGVWIIPETWERTTLSRRGVGSRVNIECDLIGKYVVRYFTLAGGGAAASGATAAADARLLQALARGGTWGTAGAPPTGAGGPGGGAPGTHGPSTA